jgi:hypothetical protein
MPIAATQPVTVPERTYDQWGLIGFEFALRPGNLLDVSATMRRCNADHWSDSTEDGHTVYLRETNLIAALANDPEALQTLAEVQAGLLILAGKMLDLAGRR